MRRRQERLPGGNLPPSSRQQTLLTSWHSVQVHQRTGKATHVGCVAEPSKMLKVDPLVTPMRSEKDGGTTHNQCIRKINQTIQAEWLAIPGNVIGPMPAVLPAEVT